MQRQKAGVLVQQLVPAQQRQMNLFDDRDRDRAERLMKTMDFIDRQFGAGTVRFGATGIHQPWTLKATPTSPIATPLAGKTSPPSRLKRFG